MSDGKASAGPRAGEAAPATGGPRVDLRNNFNLVRLILAGLVVIYHLDVLQRVRPGPDTGWFSLGAELGAELGVQGFFVLSGYLVWQSLERSASLADYASKRARRILPAYAAVVAGCAILALVLSEAAREDIVGVGRYLAANLIFLNFLEPNLPGVFGSNPAPEVNGALWTLKIEVGFYILLPLLAAVARTAGRLRWLVFVAVYAGAEAWRLILGHLSADYPVADLLARQLPGQMSFFVTGIALACWKDRLAWRFLLPMAGLALLVLSVLAPWAEALRAMGIGIVVVWLAAGVAPLPDAARYGDISYGLYIVHFPIIQACVAAGLFSMAPTLAGACAAGLSVLAAFMLWHLVEKPALRRDSAYRTRAGR